VYSYVIGLVLLEVDLEVGRADCGPPVGDLLLVVLISSLVFDYL